MTATGDAAPLGPELKAFRWWLEGQLRFRDDGGDFDLGFFRPALGYSIGSGLSVWAGYGYFRSSPEGGSDFDEHRIWQQLSWSTTLDPLALSTRTRFEQRFLETGDDVGGRFRQRVGLALPLPSGFELVVNDELFLDMNSTDWGADSGFDQNRAFAGLLWGTGRFVRVEVGYLNQFVEQSGADDSMNHILSIHLQLRP